MGTLNILNPLKVVFFIADPAESSLDQHELTSWLDIGVTCEPL